MKTLFLVRHAKSSWDDPALADIDRPLNGRGERDAPRMGRRLADAGVEPDLIISSPANRALTTARLIAKELGYKRGNIVVDPTIYEAEPEAILACIRAVDDRHKCVMVFGHDPGLTMVAHQLSPKITRMPTCAVAEFTFDVKKWARVGEVAPTTVEQRLARKSPAAAG